MLDSGYIYALTDPREPDAFLAVRYIGMTTKTLARRLTVHLSEARRTSKPIYRLRWIRTLLADGVIPGITPIESVECTLLPTREMAVIAEYRARGALLTNTTDGGEGNLNPPAEVREKISKANKGRKASDEARARIGLAGRGRVYSAEARANMSKGHLGLKASAETRERLRISKLGNKHCLGHLHSQEAIEKCRQAKLGNTHSLGHIHSEATRAKISQAHSGRAHSDESRANMSVAHVGHVASPETRAKMTAANLARWARIRAEKANQVT